MTVPVVTSVASNRRSNGTGSFSLNVSPAAGDLMLAFYLRSSNITGPNDFIGFDIASSYMASYKFATGAETSITFFGGANGIAIVGVLCIAGVDPVSPIGEISHTGTQVSASYTSFPSEPIVTTVPDCLLVQVVLDYHGGTLDTSASPLSGQTERIDRSQGVTPNRSLWVGTLDAPTPGTYGPLSAQRSSGGNPSYDSMVYAIRPAA